MKQNRALSWQIGAVYVGTVIGAGFASGQEIMQFFTCYGTISIITLILSGLLFITAGCCIFYTAARLRAYNYRDYIVRLCGSRLGLLYDAIITVFLFLGTSIMFSGSGAVFEESLHLPRLLGVVSMAALTLLAVLQSLKGILRINSVVTPVLVLVTLSVLALTLASSTAENLYVTAANIKPPGILKPIFSFMFYCSYNIVLSLGVLVAFPEKVKSIPVLGRGALIGGLGLTLLAFSLNTCLLLNAPQIFDLSIPMLYIVRNNDAFIRYAVLLCIWFEIFTTTVANVFGLSSRLSKSRPGLYGPISTAIVLSCIPLALINFKKLVGIFYPLFGALSIFLLLQIIYTAAVLKLRKPANKQHSF